VKKHLLILALSIMYLSTVKAQTGFYVTERKMFYGALVAGIGFSQIDGDNYAGYHKTGIQAGAAVYSFLGSNLIASLEILYAQKGSRGKISDSGIPGVSITSYKTDLNYAQVPMVLYYIDKSRNHFGAGFNYSRLVSAKELIESNPTYNFNQEQYPFNKNDLNFVASANVCIWKNLFANLRFEYSVLDARGKMIPAIGRQGQYNNSCIVRIMYLFGMSPQQE
jgi:hypothetical protein